MNPIHYLKRILLIIIVVLFSLDVVKAEIKPLIACQVTGISPTSVSAGNGAGMVYPSISVTTPGCTNYTITNNYTWISYTKNGLTVTISVQANSGPARTGTVNIGGITLTVNQACGNYPASAGAISGSHTVCQNQNGVSYSVASISGATGYSWTLPTGATIASGNNTSSITVNYSSSAASGNMTVRGTNSCGYGGVSPNFAVTVNTAPSQPGTISGQTTVCSGSTYLYSVSPVSGATSYTWTIPSGATGSSTTNSINITFGSNAGNITVAAVSSLGCTSPTRSLSVSMNTLYPYNVTGGGTICPGQSLPIGLNGSLSGTLYKCYLNGSFQVPPITGTGGPISFGNKSSGGTYTVKGVTTDGCEILMSGSAIINVRTPSTPASSIIASPGAVCPGASSVLTVSGGSLEPGYGVWKWYSGSCGSTPAGQGPTITVTPTSTTTYYVRAEGGCVTTSCVSVTVVVKPLPSITIQPVNADIALNQNASFSVTATGPNLQYQWQSSSSSDGPWTDLSGLPAVGFQTSNLTIQGSSTFEDNFYRCKITSDCSIIYSNIVKIILSFPAFSYLEGAQIPDPQTRVLNTGYLVGTTTGSVNINSVGGSSYTIPLDVPPGVNGLTPSLSIAYSSNGGPGIAGYGWQIGGLSTINRGPQTVYHDGVARGVEMDINDRFYLDGQRLVNTSATYGDPNAQYQTENDIFTRVTPQGTDNNGPAWFKAETKSGLVFEYGQIQASKQKIDGYSPILNWYVSKVSDLFGNQILYTYIQDHHVIYPSEITYGPNKITFHYKSRADQIISFIKGKKLEMDLLLDKIIISYNSNVVKTYEFKHSYQGSSYNSYSILNEVIEYGIGTSRFNSTAISYQIPENVSFGQTLYNDTHQYISYNSILIPGDFNGDGKTDFLCLPDSIKGATWKGMRVYIGDGSDNFSLAFSSTTSLDQQRLRDRRALDINGDGIDDFVYEYGTTPTSNTSIYYYMISNGSSLGQPYSIYQRGSSQHAGLTGKARRTIDRQEDDNEHVSNHRMRPSTLFSPQLKKAADADFNGDGVNDIFINDENGYWQIFSLVDGNGNLSSNLNVIGSGTISTLNGDVLSGDFNGDGKAEIWSFETTGMKIYSFTGGTLSQIYSSAWPTKKHFFNLGDFNGDGKVDMFLYGYGKDETEYDWTNWQIYFSTGTDFEGHDVSQKKSNLKNDRVRLGDFNGDGACDVMVTSKDMSWSGTYFYISSYSGTNFNIVSLPSYPIASHNYYLGDYNGDGRTDFICTDGESPWWTGYQVYKAPGNTSTLMEKVANGLGLLTKLSYTKLSQASSLEYQKGSNAAFPVMTFQGPWSVVKSIQVDNGIGSMNTQNYYYEGAKVHIRGKGFLGYSKARTSDVSTGLDNESISGYDLTYFYPILIKSISKRTGTTDTLEIVSNIWSKIILDATNKRIFPYLQSTTQVNKLTGQYVISSTQYDNYGNPASILKIYSDGHNENIFNSFSNIISSTKWLLGRDTLTTIQYSLNGNPTITRSAAKVFNSNNNQLISETVLSGTNYQFTKQYYYYTNGNFKTEASIASGMSRSKSYSYKTDNIRLDSITDQLSHVTTNSYDNFGRLYTQKDYLGNTSTDQYDSFGRDSSISTSDGNQTSIAYAWEDASANPIHARYSVLKTGNDGAQIKTWYDILGRVIRSDVKSFDGTMIYTSTVFSAKGQVASTSEPYFPNDTPQWNTFGYDNYGRKASLSRPSGRNTTWSYNNNTITETTAGKSYTKTYLSDGSISSSSDPGGTITYSYFSDGKLKSITAPGGIVTSMRYDIAGNQDTLIDPSAGTISYVYNGFGELTSQVSPGSKTKTISYFSDGRISQKTTPEGTTKYRYNSNKQLSNIWSPQNVSRTVGYDSKGRVTSVTDSIPGSSPFNTSMTYDGIGRKSTTKHPSGITETYGYNSNGYLSSISAGGSVRWTTTGMNARQQVTAGIYKSNLNASFGFDSYGFPSSITTGTIQNYSYSFNPVSGNLNWRQNNKYSNLREDFQYDNLDRLINIHRDTALILRMSYDGNTGGILSKSDAGTFTYGISGKPYAINRIEPSTGLTPTNTQSVKYNSFNTVDSISENSYKAEFIYNSGNERAQMAVKQNGSVILTRWYPSGSYIKEISGSVTKEYTFIGGDAYSATTVAIKQDGSTKYYSILRDYLGSITHVVDSTNMVVAEYSYDAWGRMRNPATWVNFVPGSDPALFVAGRGYTGHEHLPWFNSINMNGRVYDPIIGMFMSPDNYVQSSNNSQNFNRYTYCLNNPLKYNDPTGDFFVYIIPHIGWSPHGGFEFSISFGIGLSKTASIEATIGYGNHNLYATIGASFCGFNVYAGYGTQSGWFCGAGFGVGFSNWVSTNITGVGISYSQSGGWSENYLGFQTNDGGTIFDPSIGLEHKLSNKRYYLEVKDGMNLQGPEMSEEDVEEEFKTLTGYGEGEYKIGDITTKPPSSDYMGPDHIFYEQNGRGYYGLVKSRFWSFRDKVDVFISPYATRDIFFLRGVITHEFRHVYQYNEGWFKHFSDESRELDALTSEMLYFTSLPSDVFMQHNVINMINQCKAGIKSLYIH